MLATAQALGVRFRDRVESKGLAHGIGYPWWVPIISGLGMIGGTAVALAQRDALLEPQWVTLALVLMADAPRAALRAALLDPVVGRRPADAGAP